MNFDTFIIIWLFIHSMAFNTNQPNYQTLTKTIHDIIKIYEYNI
jgi:hypothetical protein